MVWRLRVAGAELSLGESIYLGSGEARKTQQIVLSGIVPPGGTTVRWAIRRDARRVITDHATEGQVAEGQPPGHG
jgi:uncharacterized heparinase superfamily protein